MSKLIVYLNGKPTLHGHKRREFHWSPTHSCYLYEGKEFSPEEFNAKYEKAMRTNEDLRPRVKVVEISSDPEVIADDAEKTLEALRPHRLKKKTGPKAEALEVS